MAQSGHSDATLYCDTTMIAFGPVFETQYEAEAFLEHLAETDGRDARIIHAAELARLADDFRRAES